MVLFNYAIREITAKIVYYGPGLGGKTTNLQKVHETMDSKTRGKLISLATDADRTLFFDFLPLDLGYIGGYRVRFQLYTVPGQVHYNATRRLVLKGVDAVVFVADSQIEMIERDRESFENLKENLADNGYSFDSLPIVYQFNKTDLPNIATPDEIAEALGINLSEVTYFTAVAVENVGVMETLKGIIKLGINKLRAQFEDGDTAKTRERAKGHLIEPVPFTPPVQLEREPEPAPAEEVMADPFHRSAEVEPQATPEPELEGSAGEAAGVEAEEETAVEEPVAEERPVEAATAEPEAPAEATAAERLSVWPDEEETPVVAPEPPPDAAEDEEEEVEITVDTEDTLTAQPEAAGLDRFDEEEAALDEEEVDLSSFSDETAEEPVGKTRSKEREEGGPESVEIPIDAGTVERLEPEKSETPGETAQPVPVTSVESKAMELVSADWGSVYAEEPKPQPEAPETPPEAEPQGDIGAPPAEELVETPSYATAAHYEDGDFLLFQGEKEATPAPPPFGIESRSAATESTEGRLAALSAAVDGIAGQLADVRRTLDEQRNLMNKFIDIAVGLSMSRPDNSAGQQKQPSRGFLARLFGG